MKDMPNAGASKLAEWILSNQITAVVLFDHSLTVRYLNAAAEMLLSVSARMVIGKPLEQILRCPEDDMVQHLETVTRSNQPLSERELTLVLPDGRSITVDCTLVPCEESGDSELVLAEIRRVDRQLRMTREEQLIRQNLAPGILFAVWRMK